MPQGKILGVFEREADSVQFTQLPGPGVETALPSGGMSMQPQIQFRVVPATPEPHPDSPEEENRGDCSSHDGEDRPPLAEPAFARGFLTEDYEQVDRQG